MLIEVTVALTIATFAEGSVTFSWINKYRLFLRK
jgi:hypothetical protein